MKKTDFLSFGSDGPAVEDIQRRLKIIGYPVDDKNALFGKNTENNVKQFQQDRGLLVDGIVGPETWHNLVEASYTLGSRTIYLKSPYLSGDDIRTIQLWLRTLGFNPGPIDGIYGKETTAALKEFQHNSGIKSDGIVSTDTISALLNLRTTLENNVKVNFSHPETDPHSSLANIEKQTLMIDFGHGGSDKGAIGPNNTYESIVCEDIALRVGNLFKILGTQISFTKNVGETKSLQDRIELINKSNAPLVLSIHLNHSINPKAEGVSCYYFESDNHSSILGKNMANLVQNELVKTLQSKDCRIHGKTFNILRLTKIPAVIVEPAFITNPKEEELLMRPFFRQQIATAIFGGLKQFFNETSKIFDAASAT